MDYNWWIESGETRLGFNTFINRDQLYERATAEFRKEQVDQAAEVGDQSLTGWWAKGQMSFHKGAGLKYFEKAATDDGAESRFWSSTGLDPWTPGELRPLPERAPATLEAQNVQAAVADPANQLAVLTGGVVKTATDGATVVSYDGLPLLALASDRNSLYACSQASVQKRGGGTAYQFNPNPQMAPTGTTSHVAAVAGTTGIVFNNDGTLSYTTAAAGDGLEVTVPTPAAGSVTNLVPNPSFEGDQGFTHNGARLCRYNRVRAASMEAVADSGFWHTKGLVTTRTNLVPNPGFRVSTAGWDGYNATVDRSGFVGSGDQASLDGAVGYAEKTSGHQFGLRYGYVDGFPQILVEPGKDYLFSCQHVSRSSAVPDSAVVRINSYFYDIDGNMLASASSNWFGFNRDHNIPRYVYHRPPTTPPGTHHAQFSVLCAPDGTAIPNGAVLRVDGAKVEVDIPGGDQGYFDGALSNNAVWTSPAWTSTEYLSTSTVEAMPQLERSAERPFSATHSAKATPGYGILPHAGTHGYVGVDFAAPEPDGTTFTGSLWVHAVTNSHAPTMDARIEWLNDAGDTVGAEAAGVATVIPNSMYVPTLWTRLGVTSVKPAGATRGILWARWVDDPRIVSVYADTALVEPYATAVYDYFWTTSRPDPDEMFTVGERDPDGGVRAYSVQAGPVADSTPHDGGKVFRTVRTGDTTVPTVNTTGAGSAWVQSVSIPVTAGITYTGQARLRAGGAATQGRVRIMSPTGSTTYADSGLVDLTSGWIQVTATGVVSTTSVVVRVDFPVDGINLGGWVDSMMLVQSSTADPYFDGDTAPSWASTFWNGVANNSSSTLIPNSSGGLVQVAVRQSTPFKIQVFDDEEAAWVDVAAGDELTKTVTVASTTVAKFRIVRTTGAGVTTLSLLSVTSSLGESTLLGADAYHDPSKWTHVGTVNQSIQQRVVAASGLFPLVGAPSGSAWRNCWVVKNRLLAVDAKGDWYSTALVAGQASDDDLFWRSGTADGWSVADGNTGIYLANGNAVYILTIETDAEVPILAAPVQVAALPDGERVTAISCYLGQVLMCTSKGLRTSSIQSDGSIVYGGLFVEGDFSSCTQVATWGDVAYPVGFSADHGAGVYQVNLASDSTELAPAWVFDAATAANGPVGSLVTAAGTVVDYAPAGVWWRDPAVGGSGEVVSSRERLGTLDPKAFTWLTVRTDGVAGSTVAVSVVDPAGVEYPVGVVDGATAGVFYLPDVGVPAVEWLQVRMVLAAGALVTGWQLKALPVPTRQRMIRVPLMLFSSEASASGQVTAGDPWQRLAALEALEASAALVVFTDVETGERGAAYVESVEVSRKASGTQDQSGFGGLVWLTLRKVRDLPPAAVVVPPPVEAEPPVSV